MRPTCNLFGTTEAPSTLVGNFLDVLSDKNIKIAFPNIASDKLLTGSKIPSAGGEITARNGDVLGRTNLFNLAWSVT
jgi:hypothetical protein